MGLSALPKAPRCLCQTSLRRLWRAARSQDRGSLTSLHVARTRHVRSALAHPHTHPHTSQARGNHELPLPPFITPLREHIRSHSFARGGRSFVRQPTRYVTAHAGSSAIAFPRSRGAKYLHPPLHTPTVGGRKQGATHARAQLVGWAGSTMRKSKASTAASSESGS